MTDYTTSSALARVVWPEPIEQIWQVLPGCSQSLPTWKRPDLGLSERLFIRAVLNLPKDRRRWGIVTWLAGRLNVSRPSLYAIGKRTRKGLLPEPALPKLTTDTQQKAASSSNEKTIPPNRIRRTALALLLPGGFRIVRQKSVCRLSLMKVALLRSSLHCYTRRVSGQDRSWSRSITRFWEKWCKPETNCLLAEARSC